MSQTAIFITVVAVFAIIITLLILMKIEKDHEYEEISLDDVEIYISEEHIMFFYRELFSNYKRTYRKYSVDHGRWITDEEVRKYCKLYLYHPIGYLGNYQEPYMVATFERDNEGSVVDTEIEEE